MCARDTGYHYTVMRRAIGLIDAGGDNLSLPELAGAMGMSHAHFQRLFYARVGVSTNNPRHYLRLGHARQLLAQNFTTLDVRHFVGLSGGGRLHNLFIRWEAMRPDDVVKKGQGMTIYWGWFDSPFGLSVVMGTKRGICGLGFAAELGAEASMADLKSRWPMARFVENPTRLRPLVDAAYAQSGETRLHLIGAPLQIKVWEALMQIPSGQVTTYSAIAQAIGVPRAVRAVGTAVGRNPISWLIPCHRVLRKSGELGGYHWGLPLKRALLAYESAHGDMPSAGLPGR